MYYVVFVGVWIRKVVSSAQGIDEGFLGGVVVSQLVAEIGMSIGGRLLVIPWLYCIHIYIFQLKFIPVHLSFAICTPHPYNINFFLNKIWAWFFDQIIEADAKWSGMLKISVRQFKSLILCFQYFSNPYCLEPWVIFALFRCVKIISFGNLIFAVHNWWEYNHRLNASVFSSCGPTSATITQSVVQTTFFAWLFLFDLLYNLLFIWIEIYLMQLSTFKLKINWLLKPV